MKVLITGATGVVGRRAVPALVGAGHDVTAVARSDAKAAAVEAVGAQPVRLDLFDPAAVRAAVAGHDAVINLATRIPPPSKAVFTSAWAESDRLRTVASGILVDAALDAGVSRFVQESIAFIYPDSGDRWLDEDVPLDPPKLGRASVAAERSALRFGEAGGTAVILRFGQFYAPDAVHSRYMRRMARWRMPAMPGPRNAYSPALATEDAGTAVVAALGVAAGTWNVTDNRPLTRDEYNRAVADALGCKPPIGTGELLFKLSENSRFYLRSMRVSNKRFTSATGWSPRFSDAAEGWRAMAAEWPS